MSKETTIEAKETYYRDKRALLQQVSEYLCNLGHGPCVEVENSDVAHLACVPPPLRVSRALSPADLGSAQASKETYYRGKRELLRSKRGLQSLGRSGVRTSVKRDLLCRQKGPL